MKFDILKERINKLNYSNKEEAEAFEQSLDLVPEDISTLAEELFSKRIHELDMDKMPFVIDILYKSNNKLNVILCCMLLEATCDYLPFVTPLENYILFKAKYDVLKNTLIEVFSRMDNGIGNCMALIILNTDPTFSALDEQEKNRLMNATSNKLEAISRYLKNEKDINEAIYQELELMIDLAIYMDDEIIKKQISDLDNLPLNFSSRLFIAKYKLFNNIVINDEEIQSLLQDRNEINRVVRIFEESNRLELLKKYPIEQEEIAKAEMISWLIYPTELGKEPDDIKLLGTIDDEDGIVYIYKFKSDVFEANGYMLGIVGAYPKEQITSQKSGLTFSKFETVEDDFLNQGKELVQFIKECWKNRASEQ